MQPQGWRRAESGKESSLREADELLQVKIAASGKEKGSIIAGEEKPQARGIAVSGK